MTSATSALLGAKGLVEEMDYSLIDKKQVLPNLSRKYGIGNYLYSYIFAVNSQVVKGKTPKTWADFFNLKDFPGKRALPGSSQGTLEAALLADGVDPAKLYPLDVDRAIAKIKSIKAECVFWKSGAQSEDLLRQNEVMAALMWSNRAVVVRRKNKNISWTWDKAILAASGWAVPKGNPGGKADAMKFINLMLDPAGQAKVFEVVGMSPSNPKALPMIPADEQAYNATASAANQIAMQDDWYAKFADAAEAKYLEAISS
ncbi:extracellular solute-binding protein [Polaromonas sp. P2-4]|nr:extracellular solute-binding protein [Polaromonas sp. P2-4]